jgi:hypothetical protein
VPFRKKNSRSYCSTSNTAKNWTPTKYPIINIGILLESKAILKMILCSVAILNKQKCLFSKMEDNWALVVHAYNLSYSGGRDQKDCDLKPVQANSSRDPISNKPSQKWAGEVAQGVGLEFKPQYYKNNFFKWRTEK